MAASDQSSGPPFVAADLSGKPIRRVERVDVYIQQPVVNLLSMLREYHTKAKSP